MNTRIKIQGVSFAFGELKVLKEISLSANEGEILGLLGPSGAGKTTLIRILTGQLKQDTGNVEVLGIDSKDIKTDVYTQMGMVLDNIGLYERLTCYDNLKVFTDIYGISKDNISIALEKVDLLDAIKRPVSKLSKGMKQRLALARAIIHQPKILFLDEPTSGLDPATSSYIHQLILEEKQKGTTIFLTTHNMMEASKLCDHVALMNHGKIVEYGKPEEICNKYNHQNAIDILLKDGVMITLKNEPSSAEIIADYFRKDKVKSIRSTEPNLETVFIELTGRGLEQ